MKKLIAFLCMLMIAMSLLNSNAFGAPTLIAYFLFTVVASLTSVLVFIKLARNRSYQVVWPPAYISIFFLFTVYVFIHGIVTNTTELAHYYWFSLGLLIVSLYYWSVSTGFNTRHQLLLYKGIAVIALLESIVVVLQWVNIIPVPNPLFLASGTWVNPNVTAMFLALSLFAIVRVVDNVHGISKYFYYFILLISFLAILSLQCRSAYFTAAAILIVQYWSFIKTQFKKSLKFNLRGLAAVAILGYVVILLVSIFSAKEDSTKARTRIWKNSISLIQEKPLTGFGFGRFEKEYNLFAVELHNPINDHVNMAYNDLLEIGVEGGFIAILIWVLFLVMFARYCIDKKNKVREFLPVLAGFIFMQLTNFVNQAIPAMVLFIIYAATTHEVLQPVKKKFPVVEAPTVSKWRYVRVLSALVGVIASLLLFLNQSGLLGSYYENWMVGQTYSKYNSIAHYASLKKQMAGQPIFHEDFGDAFMSVKDYYHALHQYQLAMRTSSRPDLFAKSGYCCQMMHQYDSSENFYRVNEYMQAQKLGPRLASLRLYTMKKDTSQMIAKAKEIISMPVKVRSARSNIIKGYAKAILDSLRVDYSITKIN